MSKKKWIVAAASATVVTVVVAVLLVALIAGMVSLYFLTRPQTQEGQKTVTVEIVHANGTADSYTCHTDELYLDKLLIAEGLIKEEDIVDGYFETLAGETASWTANSAYWSVYVNGEYATEGICATPVEDGAVYRFEYAISSW